MKQDIIFDSLAKDLEGDLYTDYTQRILYATDASAYREIPLAVTRPASVDDIKKILAFARSIGGSVIPRGAGTSLAGQVVGPGIVMDISKHLNRILEVNPQERWVKVEPGWCWRSLINSLHRTGCSSDPKPPPPTVLHGGYARQQLVRRPLDNSRQRKGSYTRG
jgi:FAD/FMN-containing dehydrogenase